MERETNVNIERIKKEEFIKERVKKIVKTGIGVATIGGAMLLALKGEPSPSGKICLGDSETGQTSTPPVGECYRTPWWGCKAEKFDPYLSQNPYSKGDLVKPSENNIGCPTNYFKYEVWTGPACKDKLK